MEEGGRKWPQFPHSQSPGVGRQGWDREEEGESRGHRAKGEVGQLEGAGHSPSLSFGPQMCSWSGMGLNRMPPHTLLGETQKQDTQRDTETKRAQGEDRVSGRQKDSETRTVKCPQPHTCTRD